MICITIVCSHSVDGGSRMEVYITVECTFENTCREVLGTHLYYAIVTCVAASVPREKVCSEAVLSCVLAMSRKGRRVNSTAKAIIYNVF